MYDLMAAKCDVKLTREEILLTADIDAQLLPVVKNKEGDNDAFMWLITDLVCFIFGQAAFAFDEEEKPKLMTKLQAYRRLINIAQQMWDDIVIYMKETHDIEIHPLTMLNIFLELCDSPEENMLSTMPGKEEFKIALQDQITDMYKASMEDLKTIHVPDIPDIAQCEDSEKLTKEFFDNMFKIGTFHRDREAYETDEQREIHDRIVAIYYRLAELNF